MWPNPACLCVAEPNFKEDHPTVVDEGGDQRHQGRWHQSFQVPPSDHTARQDLPLCCWQSRWVGTALWQALCETGIVWNWHHVKLASCETGITWDWHHVRLASRETGIVWDWHRVRLASCETGITWDWHHVRLASLKICIVEELEILPWPQTESRTSHH